MITAEETVPNLLRAADAMESGARLRVGERAAALRVARGYLADRELAEVLA